MPALAAPAAPWERADSRLPFHREPLLGRLRAPQSEVLRRQHDVKLRHTSGYSRQTKIHFDRHVASYTTRARRRRKLAILRAWFYVRDRERQATRLRSSRRGVIRDGCQDSLQAAEVGGLDQVVIEPHFL